MTYELAKELKEAGFPQGGKGTWTLPPDNLVARRADRLYVPTFEEVIEACGRGFYTLTFDEDNKWLASSADGYDEVASTPTEAVARLWLALNKKV